VPSPTGKLRRAPARRKTGTKRPTRAPSARRKPAGTALAVDELVEQARELEARVVDDALSSGSVGRPNLTIGAAVDLVRAADTRAVDEQRAAQVARGEVLSPAARRAIAAGRAARPQSDADLQRQRQAKVLGEEIKRVVDADCDAGNADPKVFARVLEMLGHRVEKPITNKKGVVIGWETPEDVQDERRLRVVAAVELYRSAGDSGAREAVDLLCNADAAFRAVDNSGEREAVDRQSNADAAFYAVLRDALASACGADGKRSVYTIAAALSLRFGAFGDRRRDKETERQALQRVSQYFRSAAVRVGQTDRTRG
jgi:hypothetical protein